MIKRLLCAALLAALLGAHGAARAQTPPLYVLCIAATGTLCNTTANPGNGTQGDDAWLAFGKVNLDLAALQPPSPQYSLVYANGVTWGALLPTSTGTWCLQWGSLNAPPTLVTCSGGGGGSPGFNAILSGTNSAAAMVVTTGASLNPAGSGIVNANELNGGTVPASQPCLGSSVSAQLITGSCGSAPPFSAVTSGTNAGAAMVVASGATLGYSGSGVVNASEVTGNTLANNQASSFTDYTNGHIASQNILQKLCPTNHTFSSTGTSDTCTLGNTASDAGYSDCGMQLYHAGSGAGVGTAAWSGPNYTADMFPQGCTITILDEIGGVAVVITPIDTLVVAGTGAAGSATTVCPSGCTTTTLTLTNQAAGMITMMKTSETTAGQWYVQGTGYTTP